MSQLSLENWLSEHWGPDIIFEVDRSQRNPDGSFVQVNTGEIRGIVVGIHSSVQHETLFFTIADMSESEIERLRN